MTTLCRAYSTEHDAQAAVDHLLARGFAGQPANVNGGW